MSNELTAACGRAPILGTRVAINASRTNLLCLNQPASQPSALLCSPRQHTAARQPCNLCACPTPVLCFGVCSKGLDAPLLAQGSVTCKTCSVSRQGLGKLGVKSQDWRGGWRWPWCLHRKWVSSVGQCEVGHACGSFNDEKNELSLSSCARCAPELLLAVLACCLLLTLTASRSPRRAPAGSACRGARQGRRCG